MKISDLFAYALVGAAIGFLCAGMPASVEAAGEPDFTHGAEPDLSKAGRAKYTWNLGPTGARGWIHGEKHSTSASRQIYVTQIDAGSPADGVLKTGDVILGIANEKFSEDARRSFGQAITAAEGREDGQLELLIWREGKKINLSLNLPSLGEYSADAPLDCEKSRRIVAAGCRYIADHPGRHLRNDIQGMVNGLALLASGNREYLPQLKRLAEKVGPPKLDLDIKQGFATWNWGYKNMFLTEYFLATGDDSVVPAIREYANSIARGQSMVGTWGHKMANMDNSILHGYGAVNQASLVAHISLLLTEKCGLANDKIRQAIRNSKKFFDFYVGKGSIPYGDHTPWYKYHSNNGANGSAAVMFGLSNDDRGADFFSKLTTASYTEREYGHTGNYFSYLWGPLGVNLAGPKATAEFLESQFWYYDLARRWDGGFAYQGGAGYRDSYEGWDCTGIYVLTYALPLRNIYITGKKMNADNFLADRAVATVIEAGRPDLAERSDLDQLIGLLSSWSPIVRRRAATAISKSTGNAIVPTLIEMLGSEVPNQQYGACLALEKMGPRGAAAVEALIDRLNTDDLWLRIRVCHALAGIGEPARKAADDMLRLAIEGHPDDPRGILRRHLCTTLFEAPRNGQGGLLARSLAGIDRKLLYRAWSKLAVNEDARARGALGSIYGNLGLEELASLWPDIYRSVKQRAPSGVMFSSGIRLKGLKWMAENRIAEGMPLALDIISLDEWGKNTRIRRGLEYISRYGSAAVEYLPQLRIIEDRESKFSDQFERAINIIESDDNPPELRHWGVPEI